MTYLSAGPFFLLLFTSSNSCYFLFDHPKSGIMLGSAAFLFAAMQITLLLGAPYPCKDIRSSDISNVEHHQLRHVDVLRIRKNKATVTVTTTKTITVGMPYSFCIFNRQQDVLIQRVLQILQMMIQQH